MRAPLIIRLIAQPVQPRPAAVLGLVHERAWPVCQIPDYQALGVTTCAAASLQPAFIFPFIRLCDGDYLNSQNWPVSVTCEQSCADAGHNYADPPCCTSTLPLSS